jgi:hypothetical protein
MKRNTTKLILKLFFVIALITATTGIATPSSEACNDCMLTFSGGGAQAGCWNCGPLGHEVCEPAGDHCVTDGQCDATVGFPAPVCPPQN